MNGIKLGVCVLLVLVALCALYYYFDKRIKANDAVEEYNLEKFGKSMGGMLSTIEHFAGADSGELIKSGNFSGGKHIGNADKVYNGDRGLNIVKGENGGSGQHYLKIVPGSSGYRIQVNLKPNKYYRLSGVWKGADKGTDNLYNIVMPTNDQRDILLTCNGNEGATRPGGWTEMVYVFKTPANLVKSGVVDIYLTYKTDVVREVTDLSLSVTVPNSSNMPSADSLTSYVTGTKFNGNSWALSGGDAGLRWMNKPNVGEGGFLTFGNVLVGNASNKLFGKDGKRGFTVLLLAKGAKNGQQDSDDAEMLYIGGGQGKALTVKVPHGNGNIKYSVDNEPHKDYGDVGVTGSGEHVYAVVYDDKKGKLFVYSDGNNVGPIGGETIKNLYYNSDKLKIGADRKWNAVLYAVQIHSAALSAADVMKAGEYMRSNKGRQISRAGGVDGGNVEGSLLNCTNGNMSANAFLRDMDKNAAINFRHDNDPDRSDKYYDGVGKEKLLEMCMIEADMNPNGANEACQAYDRRFGSGYDCERNDYCPPAYYKNGKFWVYIPKKSYWAKKYGYWGARSYSNDINNARKVYQINFPECRVPDVLREEKYMGDMSKCPFVINKDNPCNEYSCRGVDWTDPAHFDKEIDNKCRVSVGKYCTNNWDKDESCSCWNPDNYENATCKEYRKRFSGIDWSLFNINDFAIEDHKDYDKIVGTARATCWGCSGAKEQGADRRYVVQVPKKSG